MLALRKSIPSCDFQTSPHVELLLPSTTAQAHTYLSREGHTVQHWQLPFLGLHEFPADLTAFEIQYFFTFTPHEREAIMSRYGDHHRLATAVHLGFIKMTGRTLDAFDPPPISVLRHLSTDLGLQLPELTTLHALYDRRQTLLDHQAWAVQLLGFRPFTERRQRVLVMHLRREAHHAVTLNRFNWLQVLGTAERS
jgi:hypothetical protein